MIKAAFFDLDETLINAEHAHKKATERAFASFGYDYSEVRKKSPNHISMGKRVYDNLKARRDGAGITEEQIPMDKLQEIREGFFLSLMKDEVVLLDGVHEILEIMQQKNIITAIVSSGTKKYVELVLDIFNLRNNIHFIITGDDVERGKPEPECYLKAYEKAHNELQNLHNLECIVFEDTESGITAGKKAGMKVVYIPTSTSVPPIDYLPDYTINSLLNFNTEVLI